MKGLSDQRIEDEILARLRAAPAPIEDLAAAARQVAPHSFPGHEGAIHAIVHGIVRAERIEVVGRSPSGGAIYGLSGTPPLAAESPAPIPPPVSARDSRFALAVASRVRDPEDRGRVVSDVLAHRAALAAEKRLGEFGARKSARDLLRRVDRGRRTIAVPDSTWERIVRVVLHEGLSILVTLAVLAVVYVYVAEFRVVPTNSMQPGIKPGDRLVVWKLGAHRVPDRWEVLVFQGAPEPGDDWVTKKEGMILVKRVAGLPGERVAVDNGDFYVDGKIAAKPWDLAQALREPLVRSTLGERGVTDGWAPLAQGWLAWSRPLYADEPTFPNENGAMEVAHPPRPLAHDVYVTVVAGRDAGLRVEWLDGGHRPANRKLVGFEWSRDIAGAEKFQLSPEVSSGGFTDRGDADERVTVSLVDGVLRFDSPGRRLGIPVDGPHGHAEVFVRGAIRSVAIDRDIHYTQPPTAQYALDRENPFTVPEGNVFMLGDHSAYSRDSRFASLGAVPLERIRGRVVFRVWPPARIGTVP